MFRRRLDPRPAFAVLTAGFCILACALMADTRAAAAQDRPVVLQLSHWFEPTHPIQHVLQEWARSVEEASHGTIKTHIDPRGALGQGQDHLSIVRRGSADLVLVEPINDPSRFPVMATAALPFQITHGPAGSAAIDEWYRPLAAREMAAVKFCFALVNEPGTLHVKDKKILLPSDLKGHPIGSDNPVLSLYLRDLGATPEIAPENLLRAQLDTSAIRSTLDTWSTVMRTGTDNVLRYHMDVPFYVTPLAFVMSKATYSTLSTTQKQVIDDHCNSAAAAKFAGLWADTDIAARADLQRDEGHEIYRVPPADLVAWVNSAAPLRKRLAEDARLSGFDPDQYLADLARSLKKYKAGN
jgi:TRAP-type C4-dicarboxylate transport system substrate-binding protein